MILRVADDRDLPAVGSDYFAFGHGLCRVVGSLCLKIGADRHQQLFNGRLIEDGYGVNKSDSGNDLGTFIFRHERPPFTLQSSHLPVGVDADDQKSAEGFCTGKVADMADVKKVKTPVGEYYRRAVSTLFCNPVNKFCSIDYQI